MNKSSADLPIAKVIIACNAYIAFVRDAMAKHWDEAERKDGFVHDKLETENRESYVKQFTDRNSADEQRLLALCRAALSGGETKIRVSITDFEGIEKFYPSD